LKGLHSV